MFKIKKDDKVRVMAGKDKGKEGVVKMILPLTHKAVVEGVNFVKKHRRRTQQEQRTGIIQVEMPLAISNLRLICKNCNAATRVGFSILKDKTKTRVCKKCNEAI